MYQYLGNTGILLYDLLNNIAGVFVLLFNFSQFKYKKELLGNTSNHLITLFSNNKSRKLLSDKTFYTIIEIIIVSVFQYLPIAVMTINFGSLVGTGANYFGYVLFIPILLFLSFYLLCVNPLKQMDLIMPSLPVALALSKLACFCHGCCNGIECSFGLYNYDSNLVEFPVQMLETVVALLIFVFLMFWRKRAKEGTLYPIYLIAYSATRFFSEFLRSDPDVIWHLKIYHIFCIIGVITGIVELLVILKYGEKIKEFCTTNFIVKKIEKRTKKKEKPLRRK